MIIQARVTAEQREKLEFRSMAMGKSISRLIVEALFPEDGQGAEVPAVPRPPRVPRPLVNVRPFKQNPVPVPPPEESVMTPAIVVPDQPSPIDQMKARLEAAPISSRKWVCLCGQVNFNGTCSRCRKERG